MSWDVAIAKFLRPYKSVAEIPQDEVPLGFGARTSVHDRVLALFPGTDWSDPAWGTWSGPPGSIEFNLGVEEPVVSMMLHVRAGKEVVPAIVRLCVDNGWQGIDCSSGEFIEQSGDPASGLVAWAAYRDQIVGGGGRDA